MDKIRLEVRQRSQQLMECLKAEPPMRIPGTAIVLGRMTTGVPLALSQNIKHNHVLHEKVLLVAVTMAETPRVSDEDRVVITPISGEITRVELNFGFMEQPNVPKALQLAVERCQIATCDPQHLTYYTGHETIIPTGRHRGMARWRKEVFAFMHHNAQRAGAYFRIPTRQIMEIGIEFEM
jgi:KUP system potassium uptake protein